MSLINDLLRVLVPMNWLILPFSIFMGFKYVKDEHLHWSHGILTFVVVHVGMSAVVIVFAGWIGVGIWLFGYLAT